MYRAFKGGIHPAESKTPTSGKTISEVAPPEVVVIPLSQHTGAPAKPVVKPGDEVAIGTKIADADGFISVPMHASVSGKVRSVGDFPHPSGRNQVAVEIENDGSDRRVDSTGWKDLTDASPAEVRQAVKEAGVVGLGGAAFPSHVKLSPPEGKRIDTVILNGAECEPFLTCDHRLMLEETDKIVGGLRVMMRVLGAERGCIGIERNKPDAISVMRKAIAGQAGVDVAELRVKYPQGAEKQLIKTMLGKEVPCGGLPMDVGCLVHNVGTSLAIYEAVKFGKPLVARVVTLAGSAAAGPGNFRVRIGTPFARVIASSGGTKKPVRKIVCGGPMTGVTQHTDQVPVVKGTSGILLLAEEDLVSDEARACIRCGRCVDHCPMNLMPNEIARSVEKGRYDLAERYGVMDSIECGVCAYVCPSKINHVQFIKQGKAEILSRRRKAK